MEHQDWKIAVLKKKNYFNQKNVKQNPEGTVEFRILDSEDPPPPTQVSFDLKIKIQKARVAKKMTQKQLAQKINVTSSVISSYESGKAFPDKSTLRKISNALGVKLS